MPFSDVSQQCGTPMWHSRPDSSGCTMRDLMDFSVISTSWQMSSRAASGAQKRTVTDQYKPFDIARFFWVTMRSCVALPCWTRQASTYRQHRAAGAIEPLNPAARTTRRTPRAWPLWRPSAYSRQPSAGRVGIVVVACDVARAPRLDLGKAWLECAVGLTRHHG